MTQIHWANPVSGDFNTGADWSGGAVPGASDDAILGASGPAFTVTANTYEAVHSIQTAANATLEIGFRFAATAGTGAGANAGKIIIANHGVFTVGGMLTNTGAIAMTSDGTPALLAIGANTTLAGGGVISMSDVGLGNLINASKLGVTTLTNIDNTISGSGGIGVFAGGDHLTLINEAKGVIDASGTVASLYVEAGGYTSVNAGLIEATGGGSLELGDGTFANTGTIRNTGTGELIINATIDDSHGGTLIPGSNMLLAGGVILGGVLTLAAGQTIAAAGYVANDLATATITNRGTIAIDNQSGLTLQNTVRNYGVIALESTAGYTFLRVGGAGLTLSGGGTVILNGGGGEQGSHIFGDQSGAQILTNIDNTISGAGTIGVPSPGGSEVGLVLVNEAHGVIDANAAAALTLSAGAITNSGLIEATGPGGLNIESFGASDSFVTVNGSTGGAILAANGSNVTLQNADLIGGTLASSGSGFFRVVFAVTLDGTTSAVTNLGTLAVNDGEALTIQGAIQNKGKIGLQSVGGATRLLVGAAGVTLSGGGRVILDNSASIVVKGASSTATLTNVDNTLSGAGSLGAGQLMLVNQAKGVIVGSLATALIIDTGANAIANAGLIVAKGAGGVTIQSAVNNSGLLEAAGGVLTVSGAVSGSGEGVIASGTLDFTSSFTQRVIFTGASGVLELARSQSYTGPVFGFSKTGGTSLDLRDIGFVSSIEATFKGSALGGILTVTDGTHTAHIILKGDYRASTFIASSDGHGGTIVVDPAAAAHRFIAASAALGAGGAGSMGMAHEAWRAQPPTLSRPGTMTA